MGKRKPTHRCKICGAMWRYIQEDVLPGSGPTWNLFSRKAGPCCDNVPMADQIVALEWPDYSRMPTNTTELDEHRARTLREHDGMGPWEACSEAQREIYLAKARAVRMADYDVGLGILADELIYEHEDGARTTSRTDVGQ